ncbi:MAG: chemotaxis protein CheW [Candidatus Obscuribacterales bacterium]|nr:chemotaxis protein CheW [Candidatus Obscuribacterales bacterium]
MTEIEPEFLKQLQEAFVIEAREQLQSIMTNILNLENCNDEKSKHELAEAILHELHSLKGNARAAGILSAEALCQSLESAILSLRRKKELLNAEAADVFHKAIDLLDEVISKVEAGEADFQPASISAVLQGLKELDERQRLAAETPKQESKEAIVRKNLQQPTVEIPVAQVEQAIAQAAKPQAQQAPLVQDKGASTRIALLKLDKLLRESEEMLVLKQITEQHLDDGKEMRFQVKQLKSMISKLAGSLQSKDSNQESDELLQTLSDLQSGCMKLEQSLNSSLRRQQTEQRLCFNMVDGFIDSVKSLMMQDFSSLLSLVPKVVRDLARELKKELDLEIFGAEIEIDKRILEEIKDPLIHLVRNCLDHGIESSAERTAAGKPARASLKIGAKLDEGGHIQLIIADDGRGINAEKLKAVALKEGAISSEEAAHMSDSEAYDLMYRSSISTSETVNEISGRGIGMAIVRERIHELGGRILLKTELHKGSTFTLQLPTKLSTFRGIQVLCAGQSFIIPTLNVHYAGRVLRTEIKQSGNRNVVSINGQLTSVQNLADILKIKNQKVLKAKSARNYQQLVVLESGGHRAGFLVDEILHEHEVLVRGLSYPLVRVANIAGATMLGSGQVVAVLNISDLLLSSQNAPGADDKLRRELDAEAARNRKLSEQSIFLVDRQATSLVMLKSVLKSEGYLVQTFDSNESALEGLDENEPLILIKSCELPETQESGLAYWIRNDLRYKDMPIIFFGSHSKEEGEIISRKQGGNAYFSKMNFDRSQILELIENLT